MAAEDLGDELSRYRVISGEAVKLMQGSLERYGQISPVVAYERGDRLELIDGFKRLRAARALEGETALSVRVFRCDEQTAKAAIYLLNRVGGRTGDLEEAWIVHSLVRDDGLTQQEVATLLGKHKSWVCRRLGLIERVCPEAREDLELGILTPTAARELMRLPRGNQAEVLEVVRRESLSAGQTAVLVDAFLSCASRSQQEFVLTRPAEVLSQEEGADRVGHDPRLSATGNRAAKRLGLLLDLLSRVEGWLTLKGRSELTVSDLVILEPAVIKLRDASAAVTEAARDFASHGSHGETT